MSYGRYILVLFLIGWGACKTYGAAGSDSSSVELVRIFPEPFHDFLTFEFKVEDEKQHPVKIKILNTRDELIFFESVLVYEHHDKITISTIDFFDVGLYSIRVEIDKKYKILKKTKRY